MNIVLGLRSNGFVDAFLSWSPPLTREGRQGRSPVLLDPSDLLCRHSYPQVHAHTHSHTHTQNCWTAMQCPPDHGVSCHRVGGQHYQEHQERSHHKQYVRGSGWGSSPGKRALSITGSRARNDCLCDLSLHPTFYHFPKKPCLSAFGGTQTRPLLLNELTVRWRGFKPQLGH